MKIFCKNLLFYFFVHQFLANLLLFTQVEEVKSEFTMQMLDHELKNSFDEFEYKKGIGIY